MTTNCRRVSAARVGNMPTTPLASASLAKATEPGKACGGDTRARESQDRSASAAGVQCQPAGAPAKAWLSAKLSCPPGEYTGSHDGTLTRAPMPAAPDSEGGKTSKRHTVSSSLENQNSTLSALSPVPRKVKRLHSASPTASTPSKMPALATGRPCPPVPPTRSESLPNGNVRHCGSAPKASTSTARLPGSRATEMFTEEGVIVLAVMRTRPRRRSAAKLPPVKVWPSALGSPLAGPQYKE
mmetsp:Transcript_35820/g.76399  ORF Transcript_35820/g.76399 Transcript_35820/m.76399 type:complete len:241 (+) Transcript_35820:844-1566(+)